MTDQGETEIQDDSSGDVSGSGESRHRRSVQRAAEREVKRRTWSFYAYWGLLLVALLLAIWVLSTGTERAKEVGTSAVAIVKKGLGTDPEVLGELAKNIDQETAERSSEAREFADAVGRSVASSSGFYDQLTSSDSFGPAIENEIDKRLRSPAFENQIQDLVARSGSGGGEGSTGPDGASGTRGGSSADQRLRSLGAHQQASMALALAGLLRERGENEQAEELEAVARQAGEQDELLSRLVEETAGVDDSHRKALAAISERLGAIDGRLSEIQADGKRRDEALQELSARIEHLEQRSYPNRTYLLKEGTENALSDRGWVVRIGKRSEARLAGVEILTADGSVLMPARGVTLGQGVSFEDATGKRFQATFNHVVPRWGFVKDYIGLEVEELPK